MDRIEALNTLRMRLLIAYLRLGKVLARLDVPIGMAKIDPDHFDMEHHESMEATLKLLKHAPMHNAVRVALVMAATDWLSAMTLAAVACDEDDIEDSPEWLFGSALVQSGRALDEIGLAEAVLDGRIPPEGFEK